MKKNRTTQLMSIVLMIVFVAMFIVLSGRFLYIQGTGHVSGVSLEKWAKEKRDTSYPLDAKRGKIRDRNGVALAYDRPVYRVYAIVDETYSEDLEEPKHVKNVQKTAEKLAPVLDMEPTKVADTLKDGIQEGQFQVEFGANGKNLPQEKKENIESLDLPGINFEQKSKRYYPNGTFASKVIGLAQKEGNTIAGKSGIEAQMDNVLSGENGAISYQRDKFGTKLLNPDEVVKEAKDGNDVHITLDQKIQMLLEDTMTQVEEEYHPKRMTAIVMDPETGETVAMGNRPSYNPNKPGDVENWYNDAISTPVEPGSTMKIFTLAAAMEEGVYNPNELYKSGSYQVSEEYPKIHDHNGGNGWGTISFKEGMLRSSNVAAAKLAWEKLGPEAFLKYLEAFRFDGNTGIDLPSEKPGKILYDYPIEKITTSFGQGTTVTPIQQMMAATAIANDGKMVRPHVVSKVTDADTGKVLKETDPEVVGNPISEETASRVRDTLEAVITSEHGTGQPYKINDYSVAGKTGTAQIPDPETGNYMSGKENHIFSFLGMAPKDDPELMMYVSIKQPELDATEVGSEPTSFIFTNVMENSLHYRNIDPDKQEDNENVHTVKIPDVEGESIDSAKKELEKQDFTVNVIGEGDTVKQMNPSPDTEVLPNERILLLPEKPTMPDLSGWSTRDVLKFKELAGLKLEMVGNGYAVKQSMKKGDPLNQSGYLVVEFSPPDTSEETNQEDGNTEQE